MFRDLLRLKLPRLSQHLHHLQKAANREAGGTDEHKFKATTLIMCMHSLSFTNNTHTHLISLRQLRAPVDQRVHYAVVPHHVRHLPAGAHRAQDLGLGFL